MDYVLGKRQNLTTTTMQCLGSIKKANIIQIEHVDYLLIFLVSKEYNKHQSTNSVPTTRSKHVFYKLLTLYSPGINIQCYSTPL